MGLAFPKHKPYRDAKARHFYRQRHAVCEACGARRSVEVHHLVSRARGGSDEDENLVALDAKCHREWTGVNRTRRMWFERYAATMSEEAREKVRRALRLG